MVKYESGTTGDVFDLSGRAARLLLKETELYDYAWDVEEIKQELGSFINGFGKKAAEYKMEIDFTGSRAERADSMAKFFEVVEQDILAKKTGKLYLEDQYINCFVIKGAYEDLKDQYNKVRKEVTVYAPYPFWIVERKATYQKQDIPKGSGNLDYAYDFPYDMTPLKRGIDYLENDHYTDSHFKMIIYGPASDPAVYIQNQAYQVYTTIEEKEYLVIDSKEHTVCRVKNDGTKISEYNNRLKEQSIFEKIPAGIHQINWSGNFGFDIILFHERSEPKWN